MDAPAVKGRLFDFLESRRERFDGLASRGRYGDIVRESLPACRELAQNAEETVTAATALLHYVTSRAALPSQRKADAGGVILDMVIPGLREMRRKPESALVILVSRDRRDAEGRLALARTAQPGLGNVWLLTVDCAAEGAPNYALDGDRPDMADMVDDMVLLVRGRNQHRLGLAV